MRGQDDSPFPTPQQLAELREISDGATSDRVRFKADVWTMYALWALGDYPAARTLGERMVDDPYDRNCGEWKKPDKLVRNQHANTLVTGLWWGELQAFDLAHAQSAVWASVQDVHGHFDESAAAALRRLQEHIAERRSYRFQMELQSTYL